MSAHITQHRKGFGPGRTEITGSNDHTGIAFSVLKLRGGETHEETAAQETAWLLMEGRVAVTIEGKATVLARKSLFDESASCLHVAAGEKISFKSETDVEFTIYATSNKKHFKPRLYTPKEVPNEHRGAGQVGGACLRFVRTIFDGTNADPNAELVLGEVVTMPGRWSSYPPHHHPQPEIYHYRFTKPQGFGHAELGDTVLKVRQFDTVKIMDGVDHPQCAAPGYGMYYAWVIRHLPGKPYTIPDFTDEHKWTMEKGAESWFPAELAGK